MKNVSPAGGKKRILIVDDAFDLAVCYCELLLQEGYDAAAIGSCEEALEELPKYLPLHLILVDYSLPGMNGEQFVRELKIRYPNIFSVTTVVVFSNYADYSSVANCVREAGAGFMEKPSDLDEFIETVHRFVRSNVNLPKGSLPLVE